MRTSVFLAGIILSVKVESAKSSARLGPRELALVVTKGLYVAVTLFD